ncbi:MAG: glycine dehydrogenase [Aquificae bacterium]|nr:glycine dehydrogenase [Aquificota bacterium]
MPTVSYDLTLRELKTVFRELGVYEYLTLVKEGKPIGLVFKRDVYAARRDDLIAGDFGKVVIRLKNFDSEREGLIGIIELLPVIKEPVIVVDKKGKYLGVLTYEVLLHYLTKFKDKLVPFVEQLRERLGTESFLYLFGIKNLKQLKELLGWEKARALLEVLAEDAQELFKGELEKHEEEVWLLSADEPSEEKVKELFDEFFKELELFIESGPPLSLYGIAVSLKPFSSQESLYKKIKELKERVFKINSPAFVLMKQQLKLALHDPKRTLMHNIKEKILNDFSRIVSEIERTPQDLWELTLYDMFKRFPYFELFYVISARGLQVSNNVVNPSVNYFVAQGKKGADRSDRPYFTETMQKGAYVSDIYLSKATDDFCITVAKRFEYEGKRYVLAGDINFREIHKLVKEMG